MITIKNEFTFIMTFDLGASTVVITPEAASLLGYSKDDLKCKSTTLTASNEEEVSQIKLKAINLYGEVVKDLVLSLHNISHKHLYELIHLS